MKLLTQFSQLMTLNHCNADRNYTKRVIHVDNLSYMLVDESLWLYYPVAVSWFEILLMLC